MPLVLAISAITLTMTTAMALLPALVRSPPLRESAVKALYDTRQQWYVVRSPRGRWYLNGEPLAEPVLERRMSTVDPSGAELRFLPSSARMAGRVASDLIWLQQVSAPLRLHLEGELP